jgi:peptide deformylase
MITQNIDTLRNKSVPFDGTEEDLKHIISILDFELSHGPMKGAGLSAIQINIPVRVAIIRVQSQNVDLYNAEIIRAEQPFVYKKEGCLSFPNKFLDTNRYNLVVVRNGDGKELTFSGFAAVVVQHEIGHWDGDLYLDHTAETITDAEVTKA